MRTTSSDPWRCLAHIRKRGQRLLSEVRLDGDRETRSLARDVVSASVNCAKIIDDNLKWETGVGLSPVEFAHIRTEVGYALADLTVDVARRAAPYQETIRAFTSEIGKILMASFRKEERQGIPYSGPRRPGAYDEASRPLGPRFDPDKMRARFSAYSRKTPPYGGVSTESVAEALKGRLTWDVDEELPGVLPKLLSFTFDFFHFLSRTRWIVCQSTAPDHAASKVV